MMLAGMPSLLASIGRLVTAAIVTATFGIGDKDDGEPDLFFDRRFFFNQSSHDQRGYASSDLPPARCHRIGMSSSLTLGKSLGEQSCLVVCDAVD